jgi:DNA-binding XRE family transcriptional regulator/uncharacterized RmlC-like cupin family protein
MATALETNNQDPGPDLATGSNAPPTGRTLERALGLQIRSIRRGRDLSLADLATASGISSGMLSKIENGQISPSLTTVQAVARALNVPISALFAGAEERRDCSFVRASQGVIIERRGTKVGHVYELLGHVLGGGDVALEPFLITLREDATPYTAFQHDGLELIYMLTGRVGYRHGDQVYELAPGDALLFDSAAPHGPELLHELPMTYLSVIVYSRS